MGHSQADFVSKVKFGNKVNEYKKTTEPMYQSRVHKNSSFFRCHIQGNRDTTNPNTDLENIKKTTL